MNKYEQLIEELKLMKEAENALGDYAETIMGYGYSAGACAVIMKKLDLGTPIEINNIIRKIIGNFD